MAALGYGLRDVPEGLSLAAFLSVLVAYVLRAPRAIAFPGIACRDNALSLSTERRVRRLEMTDQWLMV